MIMRHRAPEFPDLQAVFPRYEAEMSILPTLEVSQRYDLAL